ncbi:MAG: NADPH-dependent assimilatory sulfite reductase hemoprotein subunit [Bacteroidales bacterium]
MNTLDDIRNNPEKAVGVEKIKADSNYLRGTINESLIDRITGAVAEDDTQLLKFHGIYQQTDRELGSERKQQKLEPYFIFMARVRVPGGISTSEQWLAMDRISDEYGNGTVKLTTRQAFQFHGILKANLKDSIKKINDSLLDTISACGDVNRNVMCSPNPLNADIHAEVNDITHQISRHLTPQSPAYHEIWLDKQLVAGGEPAAETEPLYTKHYLPRKFKIALVIPPYNDTDIFTNDIGLIAIEENGKLAGFNIAVGGGMGNTIGDERTYPRLGTIIGFVEPGNITKVVESVVLIQRDFGNREDRKIARLKYTIDNKGIDWFTNALETRSNIKLLPEKPYTFKSNQDVYGWGKDTAGNWHFGLFIENGRIRDTANFRLKTCVRKIAEKAICDFRLSGNQNLILGNVIDQNKPIIDAILSEYEISNDNHSALRKYSLACVALNTCPLAFAEAERYLPGLIDKIDKITLANGIEKDEISLRMTGCTNGCARPYNAEIAFVGRAPGVYNMYLGGNREGSRLNRLYKEMLKEPEILKELEVLFKAYATGRKEQETFGDFTWRKAYVTDQIPITA